MKNLKKVLSVALALAMALSLMTTAFAAVPKASDLTGYNKVGTAYTQAVDMMVGLGVINGVSGDVQAQGNVTREQAAKIICTMLEGDDAASLTTTTAPFADVAATRWSAPYIAYCVEKGIVSGVGSNKFNPTGNVTGNQFAKMLLVALGYNATTEGYTGTNWAVNVSSDAADAGIYKNASSVNKNAAATREQACLYAWNTVKATMVEYATSGTSITIGDTSINVGGSKATSVYSGDTDINTNLKTGTADSSGKYTLEFGEKYFSTLKKTTVSADAFGRPASQYKVGTTTVGTYSDTADVTYTAATKASKIASDLSGYTIYNAATGTAADVNVNNSKTYTTDAASGLVYSSILCANTNTAGAFTHANGNTIAADIAALTANGKTVEIFADTNNVITKIVTIAYTVGKVTSVTTTSTQTSYSIANGSATGIDYVDDSSADTISINGTIAKGDYVTYVKPTNSTVTYVYPTTTVEGIQTSNSTYYSTILVGGTTYNVGTGVTGVAMGDFANSTKSAVYYIDQLGFAVKTTAASASTDYAYIIGKYASTSTTVDGTVPTAQLKVVKADGSVGTYTLKLTKLTAASAQVANVTNSDNTMDFGSGSAAVIQFAAGDYVIAGTNYCVYEKSATYTGTATASSVANTEITDFVTANPVIGYTISDSTLTAEVHATASNSMDGSSVYVTSSSSALGYGVISATVGGAVATISSTATYVLYNTSTGTATVYTGNSGLPTAATGLTGYIVAKSTVANGAACTANVVFCTTTTTYSAASVSYAYINYTKYSLGYDASGNSVYTYYATAPDGSTVNLTLTPATNSTVTAAISANGVYSYSNDDVITAKKADSATTATGSTGIGTQYFYATAMTISDNVLTLTSNSTSFAYNITDDTKIVYIDSTLSSVSNSTGFVTLALNSSSAITNNVATIYVVA